MDYKQRINKHLEKFDLDIRKSNFSRFMDQKVTPDVLCFIADCIINLNATKPKFTYKDIWNSNYFEKNVRAIYGKPSPKNVKAHSEYDKFIVQPLRMLFYANVLSCKKIGKDSVYEIKEYDLLEFISIRERNAYIFLNHYITKILSDSGLMSHFEKFKTKSLKKSVTKEDFKSLKDRFIRFMKGNTPINTDVEIRRIFPKILNVYSVENNLHGTEKGHLSKHTFNFSDLMYNRENWRDISKAKGLTRIEAEDRQKTISQQKTYHTYLVEKAKDKIKRKYTTSEVHDALATGLAVHVHHIFPISSYPQLSAFLENLIKLTASQHFQKAHPNGNTQVVNRDYQCVCLLAKSESIENSLNSGELFYTKPNFVYVVNEGLDLELSMSINFTQIRTEINKAYNSA